MISFPSLKNFFNVAENLGLSKGNYKSLLFDFLQKKLGIRYENLKKGEPTIEELLMTFEYVKRRSFRKEQKQDYVDILFTYERLKDFISDVFVASQNKINNLELTLHNKLADRMDKEDSIININYDLLMDFALLEKKKIKDGLSYNLSIRGYYNGKEWIEDSNNGKRKSNYVKLHGSLNWLKTTGDYIEDSDANVDLLEKDYKMENKYYIIPIENFKYFSKKIMSNFGSNTIIHVEDRSLYVQREIIPPLFDKEMNKSLYKQAREMIVKSDKLVIIGCSLSVTDYLLLELLSNRRYERSKKNHLELIVVNKDVSVRDRFEQILNVKAEFYSSFESFLGLV